MILFIGAIMLINGTQDFVQTATEQYRKGYDWEYVGLQQTKDVPSISYKINNEKYILYRLEK